MTSCLDYDYCGDNGGNATSGDPTETFQNGGDIADNSVTTNDPFYMFRGDLVKKLLLVDSELERYLNIVKNTDTSVNTHQIKETKKQLKRPH